jgi:hypothetical protein
MGASEGAPSICGVSTATASETSGTVLVDRVFPRVRLRAGVTSSTAVAAGF